MKKLLFIIIPVSVALVVLGLILLKPRSYRPANRIICIDAGHGGHDVGAVLGERYEKDDNLALALKTAEYLKDAGFEPYLTRDDDTFVELHDRCDACSERECSYFVSFHRNSAESAAKGVEIWVSYTKPKPDVKLAADILASLKKVGITNDRGVRSGTNVSPTGDYTVNKYTLCPSCIIELGFISSPEDNALFDEKLDEYAKAIAEAIEKQY